MSGTPFYGRQEELDRLKALLNKKTSSLVVIKGRRRIGKSRLILEFGKGLNTHFFIGLPPEQGLTAQNQRDYFVQQMQRLFKVEKIKSDDWGDIFWQLSKLIVHGRMILVFDEI